jgi:hypothetical protein
VSEARKRASHRRQAGVLAVDIDQRIDLTIDADGRDASDKHGVGSVVELCFLRADDACLRVCQDRDLGFLAPGTVTETILAAGFAATPYRDFDLAAVEDVDGKSRGRIDGPMKRRRAIDADDHRWRIHAHRIDRGRRHGVTRLSVSAADDSDRAREPAQCELCLLSQLRIRGDRDLHALAPLSCFFVLTAYRTVRYTVLYSTGIFVKTQSKSLRLNADDAPITKFDAGSRL